MTSSRITIPTLFDGDWDSVIICTYGADLAFYERDLWRQIDRARNRVILADGRQVSRRLADIGGHTQLRQLNRTYVLASVRVDHAAHAKLILLLREDRGLLAVGSGNLGMNGYASQGECFTTYQWSQQASEHLEEFLAAKDFIGQILELGLVDQIVRPRVQQAWQDAPWVYGTPTGQPRVRHNLDVPLIDQFIDRIDGRGIDELVVHAPFYDHQCRALVELIARTSPTALQVLLQERITSVDPKRLAEVLESSGCEVDVRAVQAPERGTFLHAKFIIARRGDVAVCLQGSPNLSTRGLTQAFPAGNIELASLMVGPRREFDHLVSDLVVSPVPVDVAGLGLRFAKDDDEGVEPTLNRCVRELTWVPPRLAGLFDQEVRHPPRVVIGEMSVDDVTWELSDPSGGVTTFVVTLGELAAELLNRVDAVTFVFDSGEPSAPVYPYHLNSLIALASGQGRTDLLRQAGDFDLGDDELEQLLAQLDEVLVVDGRSIWRMLKRKPPERADDEEPLSLAYEDLDWQAIQSHPKLAQYRTWDRRSVSDPTGLGILLGSIADRFQAEVERRRSGSEVDQGQSEPIDQGEDLGKHVEPEDEDTAEAAEVATERRRLSMRSRARRQFQSFVRRFVNGLADEEFVRLVGPSVVVPSYVVFNHLCWKLIQIDLADPMTVIRVQLKLWRFFWGDVDHAGFLDGMGTEEQEAALEILDRHHAEAVLLCSLFQAYAVAWTDGTEGDVVEIREAWRCILDHPLWQPSRRAVADAATMLEPECPSADGLAEELDGLACFVAEREPLQLIERVLGARPGGVRATPVVVRRSALGNQRVDAYVVDDRDAGFDMDAAQEVIQALRAILPAPDNEYIRVEHPGSRVVAFADYITNDYIYADRQSGAIETLARPEPPEPSWRKGLEVLYELAS